jgi:DNA polymerase III delta subunit
MLTIIHGDNHFASRTELDRLKNQATSQEMTNFDAAFLTLTDLIQALESKSLFGGGKLVIIENLLTQKAKKNDRNSRDMIDYLQKNSSDINCILWENKEITKTILASFPKARILFFKIEKKLFQFLDSLKPNYSQKSLPLFHQILENDDPEMIFFMMIRQFRRLLLVKSQSAFLDSMSDWQEQKVRNQAKYFSMNELVKAYQDLLDIDYSIKSGQSALDLIGRLDMLLINL